MLTRLRLKNWRSVKDETIEFTTPITVFIGANSSGKTNIVDALQFYRDSLTVGLVSVVLEMGYLRIQTNALNNDENVELNFTYDLPISPERIIEVLKLQFDKRDVPFKFSKKLYEEEILLRETPLQELPVRDVVASFTYSITPEESRKQARGRELNNYITSIIQRRWQFLDDNLVSFTAISRREGGDLYVIEPDARNTLFILDFMHKAHPEIYEQLVEDLIWLLHHVTGMDIWPEPETRDLRLIIRELRGKGAPTVSSGTARLVAFLTAIYALDMPQEYAGVNEQKILKSDLPGLVVIEEPDTALNPGLLGKLVEQLRNYTERKGSPRQFILTTHNPSFLNYFKPEEVCVVERDDNGYTHVHRIPDYIDEIWLDKYGLGEVWTTNSFGGLPE